MRPRRWSGSAAEQSGSTTSPQAPHLLVMPGRHAARAYEGGARCARTRRLSARAMRRTRARPPAPARGWARQRVERVGTADRRAPNRRAAAYLLRRGRGGGRRGGVPGYARAHASDPAQLGRRRRPAPAGRPLLRGPPLRDGSRAAGDLRPRGPVAAVTPPGPGPVSPGRSATASDAPRSRRRRQVHAPRYSRSCGGPQRSGRLEGGSASRKGELLAEERPAGIVDGDLDRLPRLAKRRGDIVGRRGSPASRWSGAGVARRRSPIRACRRRRPEPRAAGASRAAAAGRPVPASAPRHGVLGQFG